MPLPFLSLISQCASDNFYSLLVTKFLITTGSVFTSGTNKSELIDLESANNVCPSFSEYPLKVVYATGGLLQEQPIICGGEYLIGTVGFMPKLGLARLWLELLGKTAQLAMPSKKFGLPYLAE